MATRPRLVVRASRLSMYRRTAPTYLRKHFPPVFWASVGNRTSPGEQDGKGPQRRWTPHWLIWVALLLGSIQARRFQDRFAQARRVVVAMRPGRRRPGRSYQGFMKALPRLRRPVRRRVVEHLQKQVSRSSGSFWTIEGWLAFAVDLTLLTLPRTRQNEAFFGHTGKARSAPRMSVTAVLHLGTGMLWDWMQGGATADGRRHLRALLRRLPPHSLIVADAGFVGYDVVREVRRAGHHLLVRAGSNVSLWTFEETDVERQGGRVYLWPKGRRDEPPAPMRLIWVCDQDEKGRPRRMALLTTVLDPADLSQRSAARLYRRRWGVEVCFRGYKRTLGQWKVQGRTPRVALTEVFWNLCGLMFVLLLMIEAQVAAHQDPWRGSLSAAWRAMEEAWQAVRCGRACTGLIKRLREAQVDRYVRCGSKAARDTPRRKRETPPGVPQVRKATLKEIAHAEELLAAA